MCHVNHRSKNRCFEKAPCFRISLHLVAALLCGFPGKRHRNSIGVETSCSCQCQQRSLWVSYAQQNSAQVGEDRNEVKTNDFSDRNSPNSVRITCSLSNTSSRSVLFQISHKSCY